MKKGFALPIVLAAVILLIVGISIWVYYKPFNQQFTDKMVNVEPQEWSCVIPEGCNGGPPGMTGWRSYKAKSINLVVSLPEDFNVEKDEYLVNHYKNTDEPADYCEQPYIGSAGEGSVICAHDRTNKRTLAILENADLAGYYAEENSFNKKLRVANNEVYIEYFSEGNATDTNTEHPIFVSTGKPTFFATWISNEGKRYLIYGSWTVEDEQATKVLDLVLSSVNFYK